MVSARDGVDRLTTSLDPGPADADNPVTISFLRVR